MKPSRLHLVVAPFVLVLVVLAGLPALAQGDDEEPNPTAEYIRSHYVKREVAIPMRDGVRLWTAIYEPLDRSRTWPMLMNRTPYSVRPYGADGYEDRLGPTDAYAEEGFIFVYQDVRGKHLSEGEFVNMRPQVPAAVRRPGDVDESTDTWDTIDWLVHNVDNHNGKVGLWGISYPGFYAAAGAIDSHPALKAVSPQAPIADWFLGDDMHHHGAFILPLTFNFFAVFGQPRPEPTTGEDTEYLDLGTTDGYRWFLDLGPLSNADEKYLHGNVAFWNQIAAHPNYDEFWQSRNLVPHMKNVGAAVLTVGGWYDSEDLYGPLYLYRSIEEKNPGAWNQLVMGPWPHGGWTRTEGRSLGDADFGFATGTWYVDHVELPFFRHFLKGAPAPDLPEALVFETGADRWRRFDRWPPQRLRQAKLHLREGGGLSFDPPAASQEEMELPPHDAYVSDPAKPVPYTRKPVVRWSPNYMTEDQRFASQRPDVLVYESEPLDHDLTLAGPLTADLWVSTSGGDSDWIVKVIDVQPNDEPRWKRWADRPRGIDEDDQRDAQLLVRAEVFRGRFRNGYETPEPFTPNEPTKVSFELRDVLHTFQRGHKLMVQIQSTWFPLVDRNPGTWVDNIFEATAEDFVPVTNRVYRSAEMPSGVRVGVLED